MRVMALALLFGVIFGPEAILATPADDIKGYCERLHQSYQLRLYCVREEEAAKKRLYRQEGLPYGIPRDVWDYCGRIHSSWRLMEYCAREEIAAKRELSR